MKITSIFETRSPYGRLAKLRYSPLTQITPATHKGKDGRQYVAVTATGGTALFAPGGGGSLVAFALPR